MFTVLHISKRDDEPQTMYQTKKIILWPADKSMSGEAWLEIETDQPTVSQMFDEGVIIVMNDNGKTVAKHKLK